MSQEDNLFQPVECLLKKVSKFLQNQLKFVMLKGNSYIRDSVHSFKRLKILILFPKIDLDTADVVGLYLKFPHQADPSAPKETLKGSVRYIFGSLFFKFKREHLSD